MHASADVGPNGADLAKLYRTAPEGVSFRRLRKRLLQQVREAISRFAMIREDAPSRWLVCMSGGKDSYAMLTLLLDLRMQGLIDVDLLACNLDQGQPGFPKHVLPDFLSALGVPYRIEYRDTYSIVREKIPEGRTFCSLCSRLRRGNLYRIAREEGCDAIILGHHRDDAIETLLMNLFHGGRLASIPPKLLNDEGNLLVLRPMIMCGEDDLLKFANGMQFPIIPCTLCGSQEGAERASVKRLIASWEASHPGRRESLANALLNVRASHLSDPSAWDFAGLKPRPPSGRAHARQEPVASAAVGGLREPETD